MGRGTQQTRPSLAEKEEAPKPTAEEEASESESEEEEADYTTVAHSSDDDDEGWETFLSKSQKNVRRMIAQQEEAKEAFQANELAGRLVL